MDQFTSRASALSVGRPAWARPRNLAIGASILVVALMVWVVLARQHNAAAAAAEDVTALPLVTVVIPQVGTVATSVSLTGQISAQNDMPIGVEGDPSRIAAVLVEPGDRVRRGQVLARLNPITAQTQVDSASASTRTDTDAARVTFSPSSHMSSDGLRSVCHASVRVVEMSGCGRWVPRGSRRRASSRLRTLCTMPNCSSSKANAWYESG